MVELDHRLSTGKPIDETWQAILDLERLVPCVEGGSVIEKTAPEAVKTEIKLKMGAISMKFTGTVTGSAGYAVIRGAAEDLHPRASDAAVIVAAHGGAEERVLAEALAAGVPYVALVARSGRGGSARRRSTASGPTE